MSLPFMNKKPREIGQLRADYAPPKTQVTQAVDDMIERMKAARSPDPDWVAIEPAEAPREIARNRLAELAALLRELLWVEMIEFAVKIDGDADKIHEWSQK